MDGRAWFLIVCSVPSGAWAQTPTDDPERRRLINEAGAARDAGDHTRALSLAMQAATRRETASLRLFIAQEEDALGQVVEALHDARSCVRQLEGDPAVARREQLMESCTAIVRSLEPRVGRLVVRVEDGAPSDLRVTVNDRPLDRDAWGSAREVLPGVTLVEAEARGRRTFHREITLRAERTETVIVRLEPVEQPRQESQPPVLAPPVRPAPASSRAGAGAGPWVVMGVGAASLAAAGVFFLLRNDALDERDRLCGGGTEDDPCTVRDVATRSLVVASEDRAETFNIATNVAWSVGAAAIAGGFTWWLVARLRGSPEQTTTVLLAPSSNGLQFGLRGAL